MKIKPSKVYSQKGWCRGIMFRDAHGKACSKYFSKSCCVLGACDISAFDPLTQHDYLITLAKTLKELGVIGIREEQFNEITPLQAERWIVKWNDNICKTKEELVDTLRKVEQKLNL